MLGGWVTLVVTTLVVFMCLAIRRHYEEVRDTLSGLDADFAELPLDPRREAHDPVDPSRPTAAMFVSGYGGLGVHSILTMLRTFPGQFVNMVFISVGVVDSGNFKGAEEVEALTKKVTDALDKYMALARKLGLAADCHFSIGTDIVEQASKLGLDVAKEFPPDGLLLRQADLRRAAPLPPPVAQRDGLRHSASAAVRRSPDGGFAGSGARSGAGGTTKKANDYYYGALRQLRRVQ